MKNRHNQLKGLVAFILLIILSYSFSSTPVFSPVNSTYLSTYAENLEENPSQYENINVTISVLILDVFSDTPNESVYTVEEGFVVKFPNPDILPEIGSRITLRGLSQIVSNGWVIVHEWYEIDSWSSIIRSVPGIGIFLLLFLTVFRFDFERIAFVPRRKKNA